MHLQPGDVAWIANRKDIVKPRKTQWTFNVLDSPPEARSRIRDGAAHAGSIQKKITFKTDFGWEIMAMNAYRDQLPLPNTIALDQIAPDLIINIIRTVNLEEYARHDITFYRHSTFDHQLIEILSKSSNINHLEILFDVRIVAHRRPLRI